MEELNKEANAPVGQPEGTPPPDPALAVAPTEGEPWSEHYDISKYPPELQQVYKTWQAANTKTRQAESQKLKAYEEKLQGYSTKVQQFDELLAHPKFQEWLASQDETLKPAETKAEEPPDLSLMSEEEKIQYLTRQNVEKELGGWKKEITSWISLQQAEQDVRNAEAKYDDFGQHVPAIRALAANPRYRGVDVESLYKIAVHDALKTRIAGEREAGKKAALEALQRKKEAASVASPNTESGGQLLPTRIPRDTFEAADMAREYLGFK